MAASRKLYRGIAAKYLTIRPALNAIEYPMWLAMVGATSEALAGESPSFDTARFLLAAGALAEPAVNQGPY